MNKEKAGKKTETSQTIYNSVMQQPAMLCNIKPAGRLKVSPNASMHALVHRLCLF